MLGTILNITGGKYNSGLVEKDNIQSVTGNSQFSKMRIYTKQKICT